MNLRGLQWPAASDSTWTWTAAFRNCASRRRALPRWAHNFSPCRQSLAGLGLLASRELRPPSGSALCPLRPLSGSTASSPRSTYLCAGYFCHDHKGHASLLRVAFTYTALGSLCHLDTNITNWGVCLTWVFPLDSSLCFDQPEDSS